MLSEWPPPPLLTAPYQPAVFDTGDQGFHAGGMKVVSLDLEHVLS